jgi:hypothetical protein
MAFGNSTFSDIGGAVSDLFQGKATAAQLRLKSHGDLVEAQDFDLASGLAKQNSAFTEQSTEIKQVQAQRQEYLGIGTETADIAGAGFQQSGSALDLLRSSAQQGALTKQVLGQQGLITEAGYNEQASAYTNMAGAARYAASEEDKMANSAIQNSQISAGIKGAAAVATLFV